MGLLKNKNKVYKKGVKFVKKGIIIIFTIIILSIFVTTGCINNKDSNNPNKKRTNNQGPFAIITAPKNTYFDISIIFDGSKSYDSSGNIVLYEWNFGDGNVKQGSIVNHTYKFENEYDVEFPIIYTVLLSVKNNDNIISIVDHQVLLSSSRYTFYFDFDTLTTEKPTNNQEKFAASGKYKLKATQELKYELDKPIIVQKSKWNATIYIKKSIFSSVNNIEVSLYNKDGKTISNGKQNIVFLGLWTQKTVDISGIVNSKAELNSISVMVRGFSLSKRVSLSYGGDKASNICFDFR